MAQGQSTIIKTKLFISRATKNLELTQAVTDCGGIFDGAIALLYAPHKCFLATVNSDGKFKDHNGEIDTSLVFEARVFNQTAELRWLNEANGEGTAVVLCDDDTKSFFGADAEPFKPMRREPVGAIEQTYLLWGESVGPADNGWARFAEARIGSFWVPVKGITAKHQRAQFTAVEYLGEYEDGNVAVAEERLTGIVKLS
jgi:CRISPR-associated protein (TIGR03984 family)